MRAALASRNPASLKKGGITRTGVAVNARTRATVVTRVDAACCG